MTTGFNSCAEIESRLSELADEALPREEALAARAHLKGCPSCRQALADLQRLRDELGRLPLLAPPDSLERTIRQRARAEGLLKRAPAARSWRDLLPALAAAAMVVIMVGIWPLLLQPSAPVSGGGTAGNPSLAEAQRTYRDAIAKLEPRAQQQVSQLPPDARQSFEINLALLDGVIADFEQVLRRQREDPGEWERLLELYQQKVDFLGLFLALDAG
jgi:anti-sigma factor RsiW